MRRIAPPIAGLVFIAVVVSVGLYWQTIVGAVTLERCVEVRDGVPVIAYHRKRFGEHKGQLHGTYVVSRRTTGLRVVVGEYRDGERHGVWCYWDEQGRFRHRKLYDGRGLVHDGTLAGSRILTSPPPRDQSPPALTGLLARCQKLWATARTPEEGLRACYWYVKERTVACSYETLRAALLEQGAVRELEELSSDNARLIVVCPEPARSRHSDLPVEFGIEFNGYPRVHGVEVRLRAAPRSDVATLVEDARVPPSILLNQTLRHRRVVELGRNLPLVWTLDLTYGERIHKAGQRGGFLTRIELRDRQDVLCCQGEITLSSLSGLDPTTDRDGVVPLKFEPEDSFEPLTFWLERQDPTPHGTTVPRRPLPDGE